MNVAALPLEPPVTPDGPTAQSWLLAELAKSEYAPSRPTWFDQLATAIRNWFDSLSAPSLGGIPGLGPLVIVIVVVVVLLVAFLVFGLPRINRRSRVAGELFGEDDQRTAARILADARAAAAAGDFSLAVVEGMRASARVLSERTLLTMYPGTTAHSFSRQAALLFPGHVALLEQTATVFDRVRYLDQPGTSAEWQDAERLASELRTALPVAASGQLARVDA
ncbi:MAG TPA: DUF4129 domain-containing protein [Galbitalea sp.]|jgi:hypothetical protein